MPNILIKKGKIGTVTERYTSQNGYVEVEQDSEQKKVAVLGLDNSHNADYKVVGASDPVIIVTGSGGVQQNQLEQVLNEIQAWELMRYIPIKIAHGDGWKDGFRSLPERAGLYDLICQKVKESDSVDNSVIIEGENSITFPY